MNNDFANRLKQIELELLALKTSSLYTSIRNVVTAHASNVYTGVYRIDYETNGESIISEVYSDKNKQVTGSISLRTPANGSQYVDVDTTYWTQGNESTTYNVSFVVISNVPVTQIVRVS